MTSPRQSVTQEHGMCRPLRDFSCWSPIKLLYAPSLGMLYGKDKSKENPENILVVPETLEVDFRDLLKGKIITVAEQQAQLPRPGTVQGADSSGKKRRKTPSIPLVHRCSRQQVSRMGNRAVPLNVGGKGQCHSHHRPSVPPSASKILRDMNPQPRCQIYGTWLGRKRMLMKEAMNNVTLDDLFRIHEQYTPGEVDVCLQWNAIGMRLYNLYVYRQLSDK